MKDEQRHFLALLAQAPARLTVEQLAWLLNCQSHDIPILVAAKILKPLGNPPANAAKYFATAQVVELANDPVWLARVTNAIHQYWRCKNARKRRNSEDRASDETSM